MKKTGLFLILALAVTMGGAGCTRDQRTGEQGQGMTSEQKREEALGTSPTGAREPARESELDQPPRQPDMPESQQPQQQPGSGQ